MDIVLWSDLVFWFSCLVLNVCLMIWASNKF